MWGVQWGRENVLWYKNFIPLKAEMFTNALISLREEIHAKALRENYNDGFWKLKNRV